MKGLNLEIWNNIGVKITTKDDEIIVPFTNVAYMKVELSEADKKTAGREPKLGEGSAYRSK
jgi:hypothetical protein